MSANKDQKRQKDNPQDKNYPAVQFFRADGLKKLAVLVVGIKGAKWNKKQNRPQAGAGILVIAQKL